MPLSPKELRGIGLLIGGMYGLDIFSSYMSSPWSTRTFAGADPAKALHARRLVYLSIATALVAGGAASYLDQSPWTLAGAGIQSAVLWWLYEDALRNAAAEGAQS